MKKYLSKLSFFIIGLSLAVTVSYLNAWTGPTQTAPNGNVSTPVNLSALAQAKLGGLSVASLLSTGNIAAAGYCDVNGQNCSSGGGMPSGSILYMATTTCPTGYLLANGASISKTTYAPLFAVIGTKFGSTATNFSLPDLRGSFIRGYGTSTAGTAASGAFGVKQEDSLKNHYHLVTPIAGVIGGPSQVLADYQQSVGGEIGTGETRPDNIALTTCIKI